MEESNNRWKMLSLVLGGTLLLAIGAISGLLLRGEADSPGSEVSSAEEEVPSAGAARIEDFDDACGQVVADAKDALDEVESSTAANQEQRAWDRYADLVLELPDCFDDEVVSGVALARSQIEELDEEPKAETSVPAPSQAPQPTGNPSAFEYAIDGVSDLGGGAVTVSGRLANHDVADHTYVLRISCEWFRAGHATYPGGSTEVRVSVRAGHTQNWSGIFSPRGGFDFSEPRTLECGVETVRVID